MSLWSSTRFYDRPGYILFCTLLSLMCVRSDESQHWPDSVLDVKGGHYPNHQCIITNVKLASHQERGIFYTRNNININVVSQFTGKIWDFDVLPEIGDLNCDMTFDAGHVVLIFYTSGASNYYHLHWDTLFPLYKALYNTGRTENESIAIMPSIESRRLQNIDWQTEAFHGKYKDKYWNQMVKFIAGKHWYLPLDNDLLQRRETICFKEIHFGATAWSVHDAADHQMLTSFVKHTMSHFGLKTEIVKFDRIGIISRKNRRRILNEDELVAALEKLAPTELIKFDGLTFEEQITLMQKYTVVAGMNGAGLMNCIYLPPASTSIQMVPYGAVGKLNFKDYGVLLKTVGPYTEWHNTHSELHVANEGPHTADTWVHTDEFMEVVKEALELARKARHQFSQEAHIDGEL